MKIKKILSIITAIIILMLSFKTVSSAETNTALENTTAQGKHTKVSLKIDTDEITIQEDVPIEIEVHIKNTREKIIGIDALVEINEDVFYPLEESDVTPLVEMNTFFYDEENENIQVVMEEAISEGSIVKIKLTPKVTLGEEEKVDLAKIYDMYLVTEDYHEEYIEQLRSSILTLRELLYLSTEDYKIGETDIRNYEDGDLYISSVNKETTKEEFIDNLETNGSEIKITKEDGSLLQEDELVGTGMTLEITKGSEKIEVQIAVIGDLDGNGKVTATDLSAENQVLLKLISLENEYFIAADLDDNKLVSATDLSTINQMIIGTI